MRDSRWDLVEKRRRDRRRELEPWSPERQRADDELAQAWDEFMPVWDARQGKSLQPGFMYFVQAGETGPIKIGLARDLSRRLRAMQTGCPDELRVLGHWPTQLVAKGEDGWPIGAHQVEMLIHRRFAHLHRRGEWFEPGEDLLAFIGGIAERDAA